jgi:hypothetical protein
MDRLATLSEETSALLREVSPEVNAARLRAFETSRDGASLWPGLSDASRVAAGRALVDAGVALLRGDPDATIDPAALHAPYALAIAAHLTGVGPWFGAEIGGGALAASPAVAEVLMHQFEREQERFRAFDDDLLAVLDALAARDVCPLLLKGAHSARVYYRDPGMRRMKDLDMSVLPHEVAAAEDALEACGFQRGERSADGTKQDWMAPGVDGRSYSLEWSDYRNPRGIELHTSLDRQARHGPRARFDLVRDEAEVFHYRGRTALVLPAPAQIALLACHIAHELDNSRLLRVMELAVVLRQSIGRVTSWREIEATLDTVQGTAFAYPGFRLVDVMLPGLVPAAVLARLERAAPEAVRRVTEHLDPAGGAFEDKTVATTIMWVRGGVFGLALALWNDARAIWHHGVIRWSLRQIRRLQRGRIRVGVAPGERRTLTPDAAGGGQ